LIAPRLSLSGSGSMLTTRLRRVVPPSTPSATFSYKLIDPTYTKTGKALSEDFLEF